jgi:hypothetical protein
MKQNTAQLTTHYYFVLLKRQEINIDFLTPPHRYPSMGAYIPLKSYLPTSSYTYPQGLCGHLHL